MQKIEGIILNISIYKNSDCVFNILTSENLLSVLGKGALNIKNKTNRLNNPFIYGEFDLYEGPTNGYKLRDCEVFEYFSEKFVTYEDHMIFNFLNELLFKIIINSSSYEGYFDVILETLKKYGQTANNYDLIVILFANLLKINGLCLNTKSCICCGELDSDNLVSIDFINGGTICKHCANDSLDVVRPEELKIYKSIFETEISESSDLKLNIDKKAFLKIIENLSIFLSSTLDVKLKSLILLKTI